MPNKLKTLFLCALTVAFAACEQRIEAPGTPGDTKSETTIVNPPGDKKVESNTTVVNPPAAATETTKESTTTTTH